MATFGRKQHNMQACFVVRCTPRPSPTREAKPNPDMILFRTSYSLFLRSPSLSCPSVSPLPGAAGSVLLSRRGRPGAASPVRLVLGEHAMPCHVEERERDDRERGASLSLCRQVAREVRALACFRLPSASRRRSGSPRRGWR